jgi:hypothetical protein
VAVAVGREAQRVVLRTKAVQEDRETSGLLTVLAVVLAVVLFEGQIP